MCFKVIILFKIHQSYLAVLIHVIKMGKYGPVMYRRFGREVKGDNLVFTIIKTPDNTTAPDLVFAAAGMPQEAPNVGATTDGIYKQPSFFFYTHPEFMGKAKPENIITALFRVFHLTF